MIQPWDSGGRLGLNVYGFTGSAMQVLFSSTNMGEGSGYISWLIGDVNGDGRAEVIQTWSNSGGALGLIVYGWVGSSMQVLWSSLNVGGSGAMSWLIGDINGDNQAEIIQTWDNNSALGMAVHYFSDGGMQSSFCNANMGAGSGALGWVAGRFLSPNLTGILQPWNNNGNIGLIAYGQPDPGKSYVGSTAGDFAVQGSGSATYTIPIQIPPGIHGVQPSLALSYDSAGSNDMLGMGFSLQGLSAIARAGATPAQDKSWGGVNYDQNDRFELDGQRLILASGASYQDSAATYRTEIDNFAKIVPGGFVSGQSGPGSFTVYNRDGSKWEYGITPDSKIMAVGRNAVRVWALGKVTDRHGNYYTIQYTADSDGGGYYPYQIRYTANDGAGLPPRFSVRFNYGSRPDPIVQYQGGAIVNMTERLTSIVTFMGNTRVRSYAFSYQQGATTGRSRLCQVTESDGSHVALPPTVISWQDSSGSATQMAQVLDASYSASGIFLPMDVDGDGYPDLVYACPDANNLLELYLYTNAGFTQQGVFGRGSPGAVRASNGQPIATVSSSGSTLNGQPAPTVLSSSPFAGGVLPGPLSSGALPWGGSFFPMDFNGDGRTDLIYFVNGSVHLFVVGQLPGGAFTLNVYYNVLSLGGGWQLLVMDLDGDGRTDILAYTTSGSPLVLQPYFSTGVVGGTQGAFVAGTALSVPVGAGGQLVPIDLDGDGVADLVYAREAIVGTSGGFGFTVAQQAISFRATKGGPSGGAPFVSSGWSVNLPLNGTLVPANLTGTGLMDLCYVYPASNGQNQVLLLQNLGNAGCQLVQNSYFPQNSGIAGGGPVLTADVNGDGLDELIMTTTSSSQSTSTVFRCNPGTPSIPGGMQQLTTISLGGSSAPFFTDGAGRGMTGAYAPANQSNQVLLTSFLPAGPVPDLATGFANGFGGSYQVSYQPLTNPNVYTLAVPAAGIGLTGLFASLFVRPSFGATGAAIHSPAPVPGTVSTVIPRTVAASYVKADGQGNSYPYSIRYNGGCFDTQGRGFLGFASFSVTDAGAGTVTSTQYNQAFPMCGTSSGSSISTTAGKQMYSTANTYQSVTTIPGAYQVHLMQVVDSLYTYGTLDETHTRNYTYDSFGNRLTESFTTTGAGAALYTTRTWQNDTTSWALSYQLSQQHCADSAGAIVLRSAQWAYDPKTGDVLTEQIFSSSANAWLTTTKTYDAFGNQLTETDPSGAVTTFQYESFFCCYPQTVTTPPPSAGAQGLTTTYAYDARFGSLAATTNPNGVTHTQLVDGLGRCTVRLGPDPNLNPVTLETQSWNLAASPKAAYLQVTTLAGDFGSADNTWQQKFMDGLMRTFRSAVLGPDGATAILTDTVFDSRGNAVQRSFPYAQGSTPGFTTQTFDEYGRVIQVQDPSSTSTFAWTAQGTMVRTDTLASGTRVSTSTYGTFNDQRLLVALTDGGGGVTQYCYDALGRPTGVVDPSGVHTSFQLDTLGRTTAMSIFTPGGPTYQQARFSHDDVHRTLCRTDALGATLLCTYDALGRPLSEVVTSANGQTEKTTFVYDLSKFGKGQLGSVTHPDNSGYTFTYDAYGRQQAITVSQFGTSYSFSKTYNAGGHLVAMVFPDGQKQSFTFSHGYLTAAADPGAACTFSYTNTGQLAAISSSAVNQTFSYDAALRLTQQTAQQGGQTVLSRTYTLSPFDGPSEINDNLSGDTRFATDAAGRLLSAAGANASTHTYQASLLTNKNGTQYGYAGYKLCNGTQNGTTIFSASYDANGNMISASRNGSVTTYTFDPRGWLRSAGTVTFSYDYTGRRMYRQSGLGSTYYVSPHFEVDLLPSGTLRNTRYLVAGGRVLAAVTTQVRAGTNLPDNRPQPGTLYFVQDHLDSTILVVDSQKGVVATPQYLPYGEMVPTGSTSGASFRRKFIGQEYDDELLLYYFQSRYYDPILGRFLSPDDRPCGRYDQADTFDRYAYALNNPIKYADPTGHNIFDDIGNFFSGFGAAVVNTFTTIGNSTAHFFGTDVKNALDSQVGKLIIMSIVNDSLIAAGALLVATTPIDGPLGTMVGQSLLNAGINGEINEISAVASGQSLSWGSWGTQLGIGAASGLAAGMFGAAAGAIVRGAADAGAILGASRVAWIAAGDILGQASSSVLSKVLNNAAGSGSLSEGLGQAALAGAMFGAAAGVFHGGTNLNKTLLQKMDDLGDVAAKAAASRWRYVCKGLQVSTMGGYGVFRTLAGPSWVSL